MTSIYIHDKDKREMAKRIDDLVKTGVQKVHLTKKSFEWFRELNNWPKGIGEFLYNGAMVVRIEESKK